MNKNISIENAVIRDIDAILEIEQACFQEDSFSRNQFKYLMSKAKGFFYVLKRQDKLIGYISVTSNSRTRNLRIYSIAIYPEERGKGYAQLLLDKTFEYAESNHFKAIFLEVKTTNIPAIRLYEKNDFSKRNIKVNYYLDGSDAFGMEKVLL